MRIDMHVHTQYSADCDLSPVVIAKLETAKGIDCVAVTDHNSFDSFRYFRKAGVKIIRGEEITTDEGHLIGLFIEEAVMSRNFAEACDEIKSQGGLAILPHPFRSHKNPGRLYGLVDAVEVFNARTSADANNKAFELAYETRIARVCGSDAHFPSELGKCVLDVETENMEDARKKIIGGDVRLNCVPSPLCVHPATWFIKGTKIAGRLMKK